LRVLVAEDSPINQIVIKNLLEDHGHSAVVVDDGEQLVERVRSSLAARARGSRSESEFDLVITDIQMPKMDGLQAASSIRAWEIQHGIKDSLHIPMIALTANAFEQEHRRIRDAGCDAVVVKPLEADLLWQAIQRLRDADRFTPRDNRPPESPPTMTSETMITGPSDTRFVLDIPFVAQVNERITHLIAESPEDVQACVTKWFEHQRRALGDFAQPTVEQSILEYPTLYTKSQRKLGRVLQLLEAIRSMTVSIPVVKTAEDLVAASRVFHKLKGSLGEAGCLLASFAAFQAEKACNAGSVEEAQRAAKATQVLHDFTVNILENVVPFLKERSSSERQSDAQPWVERT
jgi:CheY-like chemotaxis protein